MSLKMDASSVKFLDHVRDGGAPVMRDQDRADDGDQRYDKREHEDRSREGLFYAFLRDAEAPQNDQYDIDKRNLKKDQDSDPSPCADRRPGLSFAGAGSGSDTGGLFSAGCSTTAGTGATTGAACSVLSSSGLGPIYLPHSVQKRVSSGCCAPQYGQVMQIILLFFVQSVYPRYGVSVNSGHLRSMAP